MKHVPSSEQIAFYRANGFVVIEEFLTPQELDNWRGAVMRAVDQRAGKKIPGKDIVIGEDDGINEDGDYFGKVFDQLLNLWQTNEGVKELMLGRWPPCFPGLMGSGSGMTRHCSNGPGPTRQHGILIRLSGLSLIAMRSPSG
jgi:hypothetical protein